MLCPFDNFSFGPIATEPAEDRIQWVEDVLGYIGWEDVTDSSQEFLAAFDGPKTFVTAWVSRKETRTYAGFLWWLSHIGDLQISIIEVAELSIMNPENMVDLFDNAVPLQSVDRARYSARWEQLRAENVPLRVIGFRLDRC